MRTPTPALVALAAALALPAGAVAAKPPHPSHPSRSSNTSLSRPSHPSHPAAPKVLYVLRGALSAYAPAAGSTAGSVTIVVSRSNRHGKALKGETLVFAVDARTRVVLHGRDFASGDRGIVKVRGPKALDLTALQALAARQVIDQGAPSTSTTTTTTTTGS